MVMKWIAAAPIDQADIWIDKISTVILELLSRVEQQVCNARDGNKTLNWIATDRQFRNWGYRA